MLNTSDILSSFGFVSGTAGLLCLDEASMAPQDWTAMALLAALTLGGFAWLSRHFDKMAAAIADNTKAQAEVAKALALLVQENQAQRQDTREQMRDLRDAIEDIPNKISAKRHP